MLFFFWGCQVCQGFPACLGRRRNGWRSQLRLTSSTGSTRASTHGSRSSPACHSNGRASWQTLPIGPSPWWTPPTLPPYSWHQWRYITTTQTLAIETNLYHFQPVAYLSHIFLLLFIPLFLLHFYPHTPCLCELNYELFFFPPLLFIAVCAFSPSVNVCHLSVFVSYCFPLHLLHTFLKGKIENSPYHLATSHCLNVSIKSEMVIILLLIMML